MSAYTFLSVDAMCFPNSGIRLALSLPSFIMVTGHRFFPFLCSVPCVPCEQNKISRAILKARVRRMPRRDLPIHSREVLPLEFALGKLLSCLYYQHVLT